MLKLFPDPALDLGSGYSTREVTRAEAEPFITEIHYARRWPSVSFMYGLLRVDELVGVVTYGTPASAPLRAGIAGPSYANQVLELNRLVLRDNRPHEASRLVGASLKALPRNRIIVSYADTAQGHLGTVYQATNFLYCGLSAKRTDWKIRGREDLNGVTVSDMARGQEDRAAFLRDKFGDDFYSAPRPRKHRYIKPIGSKKFRKRVMEDLKYPTQSYPQSPVV